MRTLIVLACVFALAYGDCTCSRQPTTVQEAFCAADWAMQAIMNFKTNNTLNPQVVYHVTRIGNFYKFPADHKQPLGISLQVLSNKSADECGDALKVSGNYILLGTLDAKNNLVIDTCLTLPIEEGTHNPSAAEFLDVKPAVRTDLILNKITCAASSTAAPLPTTRRA